MMDNQQVVSVFYEGQDDLADILAVSICSVCYNTEKFVNFYILDCGICAFNKNSEKGKFVNERCGFSCELFEINPYCWEDCTCGVTDLYSEVEEHSGDCPFVHHNFIYRPTGFYIDWYKYSFRSSDMNQNLTIREIEDIFDKCSNYLKGIGF